MLVLLLTLHLAQATTDTAAFADARTAELVARAQMRHQAADSAVRDYQARIHYRLSFGLGRRRWAIVPPAAVEEQEGRVQWSAPNNLRVDIEGRRSEARARNLRLNSTFDEPWFVPRGLGDSVRVFGNDFPAQASLHPLAADGPQWYRYALVDSLRVTTQDGTTLQLYRLTVTPRRKGGALLVGDLWLDASSAEVARFSFRFVGRDLWVEPDGAERSDSTDARRANTLINRFLSLSCDLAYSLQERRDWMPYRQVVSGRLELPLVGGLVIPFEATTEFDDYTINTGQLVRFAVELPEGITDRDSIEAILSARRDSARKERRTRRRDGGADSLGEVEPADRAGLLDGGRFEIHRAPKDSLAAYSGWDEPLAFVPDQVESRRLLDLTADLERRTAELPRDLSGYSRNGFWWERIPEMVRYNRVSGQSLGLRRTFGVTRDGFTTLDAEARFGLSDSRVTGALAVIRDAPSGRWTLRGFRELRTHDPFARSNSFGASLNAMFVGHDDADYHLGHGAELSREQTVGPGLELTTTALLEDATSVSREASSWLNDALGGTGHFPANPPVREGTFGGAGLRLNSGVLGNRWMLATDLLSGAGRTTVRTYGLWRPRLWSRPRRPSLVLRGGITTANPLPQQAFRLGGSGTVRGFDYGTRGGQATWSVQMDWPLVRGVLQPVLFADAGQAARASDLFGSRLLAGGGLGFALLGGVLRFDFSHPFTTGGSGLRFDVGARALW
ncbi:MAG: hypothetical protein ABI587_03955 [Gemmatimonadales bacterium]